MSVYRLICTAPCMINLDGRIKPCRPGDRLSLTHLQFLQVKGQAHYSSFRLISKPEEVEATPVNTPTAPSLPTATIEPPLYNDALPLPADANWSTVLKYVRELAEEVPVDVAKLNLVAETYPTFNRVQQEIEMILEQVEGLPEVEMTEALSGVESNDAVDLE